MSEFSGTRRKEKVSVFRKLTIRDGPDCFYCGCVLGCDDETERTIDRWVPRCNGGGGNMANLRLACYACNHAKGPTAGYEFLRSAWLAERREQVGRHPY